MSTGTGLDAAMQSRIDVLIEGYGDGSDGAAPSAEQWRRLLARPAGTPTTLVNLFKLRGRARYEGAAAPDVSGQEAFGRYSAVSMPALEKVGGRFLLVGPFAGSFTGDDEDWDLVAVGTYPDVAAVLSLFEDPDYRDAFVHRRAACERQRVSIVG